MVCQEREHTKHSVYVEENQLVIRMVDERRWYHHLFNFGSDKITVYLPANQYASLSIHTSTGGITIPQDFQFDSIDIATSTGNVENKASATQSMKIKTSTGNIRVENISTTTLDLSVTTGKITATSVTCLGDMNIRVSTGKTYLTQVSCQNMTTNGSTGDVSMRQVVVTDKMSVERSTGDVTFEDCDASDILVVTDTGSVKGTLLSEKVFIAKSDTGRIQVPETTSGGKCKVTTDTGNIKFEIKQ